MRLKWARTRAGLATVIGLLLASLGGSAHAFKYEVFIEIETEEDLYDLRADGVLQEGTFESLFELYQRGVNVNTASREELYTLPNLTYRDVDRILDYRKEIGWIDDPAALVLAGALTERKLYAIASFLLIKPKKRGLAADGFVRLWTRYTVDDPRIPPFALRARVNTLRNLTVGMAMSTTRNRIGDVVYDPNRRALSALPEQTRLHVPKGYAFWNTDKLAAIVGTYRVGFGQQLVFDKTNQATPNGIYVDDEIFRDADALSRLCKQSQGELDASPCAGDAQYEYHSPDYTWRDTMLGVAVGLKHMKLGSGHLQAYGFASHQPRSIYQYELYNADVCDDPHATTEECAAPTVYNRSEYLLDPSASLSFHTLRNMFTETTVGGNLTYFAGHRTHVGATAYRSSVNFLTEGVNLDFQEWSRLPYGGPFGAVGVDLSWGRGMFDVFAEVAHSFDSMPDSDIDNITTGGGGPAAIVRGTATWSKNELEAVFRYYDIDFANPNAGPISAPDELDGLRARDEVGMRLRYTGIHKKRLQLRTALDVWHQPSIAANKFLTYVHADVDVSKRLGWGLWVDYSDKGVGERDAPPGQENIGECFQVANQIDVAGERIPCTGSQLKFTGRLRAKPARTFQLSGNVRYSYLSDYRSELRDPMTMEITREERDFRHDVAATMIGLFKPTSRLRARLRLRYLFEDVSDNTYREQLFWAYTDLTYRLRQRDRLRVRYDVRVWLDDRASSAARAPSPEHWMWLEYESKF